MLTALRHLPDACTSPPPVCRGGLEGRLLGLTLQAEHPQLEIQCSALLQQQEEQRLELAALDNHLLQSLATSKACATCARC